MNTLIALALLSAILLAIGPWAGAAEAQGLERSRIDGASRIDADFRYAPARPLICLGPEIREVAGRPIRAPTDLDCYPNDRDVRG